MLLAYLEDLFLPTAFFSSVLSHSLPSLTASHMRFFLLHIYIGTPFRPHRCNSTRPTAKKKNTHTHIHHYKKTRQMLPSTIHQRTLPAARVSWLLATAVLPFFRIFHTACTCRLLPLHLLLFRISLFIPFLRSCLLLFTISSLPKRHPQGPGKPNIFGARIVQQPSHAYTAGFTVRLLETHALVHKRDSDEMKGSLLSCHG